MNKLDKINFLKREFLTLSINGAFQHNSVYRLQRTINQKQKSDLKNKIFEELEKISLRYYSPLEDEQHYIQISNLKNWLADISILSSNVTFGTAQKLLNLYLKYLWCMGSPACPPHCPIDRYILRTLKKLKAVDEVFPWTKLTEAQYRDVISVIRTIAKDKPIPQWELEEWENLRNNQ